MNNTFLSGHKNSPSHDWWFTCKSQERNDLTSHVPVVNNHWLDTVPKRQFNYRTVWRSTDNRFVEWSCFLKSSCYSTITGCTRNLQIGVLDTDKLQVEALQCRRLPDFSSVVSSVSARRSSVFFRLLRISKNPVRPLGIAEFLAFWTQLRDERTC